MNKFHNKKNVVKAVLAVVMAAGFLTGCRANALEEGAECLEQKQYAEAADNFKEAVDRGKHLGEAYRGLGIALWEQEDYAGAKEAFANALDNGAEKTGTIYNFLGNCEMKNENYKSALNYYRMGMETEDCSEEMLQEMMFNEIAAYEKLGDYESAKAKLAEYTSQYPDDERAQKEAEFLETR